MDDPIQVPVAATDSPELAGRMFSDAVGIVRSIVPIGFSPAQYSDDGSWLRKEAAVDGEPLKLPTTPFEPYIRHYTASNLTACLVWVARGRVFPNDTMGETPITDIDLSISCVSGTRAWIEVDFTLVGAVNSCALKHHASAWPFGGVRVQNNGLAGNLAMQPIFLWEGPFTNKSTLAGLDDAPFPDLGFFPEMPGVHLHRFTHTHLTVVRKCVKIGSETVLLWTLTPL